MIGCQRVPELYSYDGCAFPCVHIQRKGQKAFVTQNIWNHTNMFKTCVVSGCWDSAEFACSPLAPTTVSQLCSYSLCLLVLQ